MRSSDWSSDVCSSDLSSPVAAATSAADERRERPELDAGDDEREGEGAALAERSDHKPRTPRQPKEANDAPAIIIQCRRGIALSGQVTDRKSGVEGKGVAVRVDFCGRRNNQKKINGTESIY